MVHTRQVKSSLRVTSTARETRVGTRQGRQPETAISRASRCLAHMRALQQGRRNSPRANRSVTSRSRAERSDKADRPAAAAGLTGDAAVPNNGRVPRRAVPSRPAGVDGVPPFDLAASQRGRCPRTGCTTGARERASLSVGQKRVDTVRFAKSLDMQGFLRSSST